mgnify:CR=1 FL=1
MSGNYYLPDGLPRPGTGPDGLSEPYWKGTREGKLRIQKCKGCGSWQWGPEWVCHRCHSFDLRYEETAAEGILYSHERVWHPVHPALKDRGPYLFALVELPHAGHVRMLGNLGPSAQSAWDSVARAARDDAEFTVVRCTNDRCRRPYAKVGKIAYCEACRASGADLAYQRRRRYAADRAEGLTADGAG